MEELVLGGLAFVLAITVVLLMWYVSYDRKQRWPELEPDVVKQRQEQRHRDHLIWLQAQQERIAKEDQEFNQRQRDFITNRRANDETQNEDTTKE
jgi:hypothetical protein